MITYPIWLIKFKWQEKLWKHFMCKREVHLFDEVKGQDHYLNCDACNLIISISKIDRTYQKF